MSHRSSILKSILNLSAWRVLFFTDMHTCIMTVYYLVTINKLEMHVNLSKTLLLLASLGFYLIYGVLVNDYFDISTDKKAGDHREIHSLPKIYVIFIMIILVSFNYMLIFTYINQYIITIVFSIAYILATLYSAPPFRLKSRGLYGLIINMLIEQTLPVFLISNFFNYFSTDILFLLILVSLRQLELIIIHQYVDYKGDQQSGVRTFAVEIGAKKTLKILQYLQPIVALLYVMFSIIIIIKQPFFIVFYVPLTAGYFILSKLKSSKSYDAEPSKFGPARYYADESKIGDLRLSLSSYLGISYEGPFSLFSGVILTIISPHFIVLLLVTIITQFYFLKGHYRAVFQGVAQFVGQNKGR
ncbi:1,4-dihydroxy-2-naphthoate octaprenyltransferase [Thaumarchaeota archaeon SCGC AB-539-E09]|nr:1,4-dihydroxy-2-naphthoate octaprenyltransferase [Thaumarchaeota archaeon SCGC AB-539-E09]